MKLLSKLVALIVVLGCLVGANAQNYETTLTGTILDSTGAKVPEATVLVTNEETNAVRTAKTTGAGAYYVSNLPIGTYRLSATAANFETVTTTDIVLVAGQIRTIDVHLAVGSVSQDVSVEDTAPALQTNTAEIGGAIDNRQIESLPQNGRSISSLLALVPGAIDSGGASLSSIRFAGRGTDDTNFRFDGVDATGIKASNNSTSLRLTTPTEAIAQLKVATLLYGADTGGTAGGQVELVSKSGTNQFHGSVFDFLRNDYFDSRGPYDVTRTPPLKFDDFGASLGGPIFKNKTFFFVVYEGIRQNVSAFLQGKVPNDAFRAQVIASAPALAPFINAYPEPNGAAIDTNTAFYSAAAGTRTNEASYLVRVQHIFNPSNSVFVRYNIDHASITGASGALRDSSITNTSPMNATVQYIHVFTPTLLNEAAIGFNRVWSVGSTASYLQTTNPAITYSFAVGSFFTSLSNSKVSESAPSTYSLLDNVTKSLGRHTIKVGFELKEVQYNYSQAGTHSLLYNSYANLLANKIDSVSVVADVPVHGLHKLESFAYAQDSFKLRPNLTLTYGLRWGFLNVLHEVHGRSQAWDDSSCGATAQCPVGGQFTIPVYTDFEPRISFGWEPKMFHGKTVIRGGGGLYHGEGQIGDLNAPSDNFTTLFGLTQASSPGLSWPVAPYVTAAAANPQTVQPRGLQRVRLDPRVTQYGIQVQTALPYRFVLDTGFIGSYGDHQFTRTYRNNLIYTPGVQPVVGSQVRPYANFAQVDYKGAVNNTSFSGWQTSLQRQFRSGLSMQINYLWSHTLNNGSTGGGESDYPDNVACQTCEYGNSNQDATQSASANAIYNLPLGHGQRYLNHGFVGALFGGISLNTIFTSRSGLPIKIDVSRPVNVVDPTDPLKKRLIVNILDGNNTEHSSGSPDQRPNLVAGVSLTPPEGRSNVLGGRWLNPDAFATPAAGTWSNMSRNQVRGPGLWQSDLGTAKRFTIVKDRVSAQFRGEIFNIFNRSQYANPVANFTGIENAQFTIQNYTGNDPVVIAKNAAALASAKTSFSTTSAVLNTGAAGGATARRVQFGLRIEY